MTELEKRKINLIIVTGKCYKLKNCESYYEKVGELTLLYQNSTEKEKVIELNPITANIHDKIGVFESLFKDEFIKVTEQLL